MTKITFKSDDENRIYGFTANGHAKFSKENDIVCSAISILTINFINSIDELTDGKAVVYSDESQGFMDVTVENYSGDDIQLLFNSLHLGLNEIAKQYSKYLKLTNRRCKP